MYSKTSQISLLVLSLCGACYGAGITGGVYTGNLSIQPNNRSTPRQPGNLIVNGQVDIYGNLLNFGTAGSSVNPAVVFSYTDDASGSTSTIASSSYRNALSWKWQQNSVSGQKSKMLLDGNNKLSLFDLSGTSRITLDPVAGQITVNGQALLQPNSFGNVGIGTTSPTAPLAFGNSAGDKIKLYTGDDATNRYGFGIQNSTFAMFMDGGNPGIGKFSWRISPSSGATAGSAGAEVMNLYTSGQLDLRDATNGIIRTYGSGNNYFAGKVGIGTASPQEKLDIAGNINLASTTSSAGQIKVGGTTVFHAYGESNFFAGPNVGNFTTTGSGNLGFGSNALTNLSSGVGNVAVGNQANRVVSTGESNVAIGFGANNVVTTGGWNVGIGNAANYTTNGNRNTAIGTSSGPSGGDFNVSIGNNAGNVTNSGDGNTFIGASSGINSGATLTNATVIGYNAKVGSSNSLILGGTGNYAVNVGIGTTMPTAKFEVVGDIKASGVIHCAAGGDIPMYSGN